MLKVKEYLKGRKTFLIAVLTILLGVLQGDAELILGGILAITLRAGISN